MAPSTNTILSALSCWILLSASSFAKNHLAGETSPHLLEHADNPVDWYPWGDEAFEKARTEKKPLFVSIGYHSCHWCHRMMIESFQNPTVVKLLNESFICVKVDREEHPDIDRIYMAYMQASQGGGGWPLNVWLTPDLVPFSVGTYFPAEGSSRQPSFIKVLEHIANQWRRFPDYIDSQSRRDLSKLRSNIQDLPASDPATAAAADNYYILAAYERLATEFDPQNGGFGSAPRFPNPSKIETAGLILSHEKADSFRANQCRKMITVSLSKMAAGAIQDQLGGGFHRYSADPAWAIPHFEKMLTDQALLIDAYLTGYRLAGEKAYLAVAEKIDRYVSSTLAAPGGGFYASQHSDSPTPSDDKKFVEGAYYKWDAGTFATAAGPDAALMAYHYGVRPEGNAPLDAGNANDDLTNTLRVINPVDAVAKKFSLSPAEAAAAIARGNASLLAGRSLRPAPRINEQIVTASNALMISALSKLHLASGSGDALSRATATMEFIRQRCYDADSATLYRIYDPENLRLKGTAEDYAFTIQANLDLYAASLDATWLLFADELQRSQNNFFYDRGQGGYFNTPRSRTDIIIRLKSYEDSAELSPNASSILNLVRLGNLLGDDDYLHMAKQTADCFRGAIDKSATLSSRYLVADWMLKQSPPQIIISGKRDQPDTQQLLAVARESATPGKIILFLDENLPDNPLVKRNPKLAAIKGIPGKASAHVCKDFTCKAPTSDPATLRAQLTTE